MKVALILGWLLATTSALAAAPTPATGHEIAALFKALKHSRCSFNRNGRWYSAVQASEHLQRKYDYLLRKRLVPNSEAFIERAASRSSSTGTPYRVRCPGTAEVESRAWFSARLRQVRAGG